MHYFWPWVLEVGNLSYLLPEVNLSQMNEATGLNLTTRDQTAQVMSEMMNNKKAENTSHPRVFSNMGIHVMKGGSLVPKEETED